MALHCFHEEVLRIQSLAVSLIGLRKTRGLKLWRDAVNQSQAILSQTDQGSGLV